MLVRKILETTLAAGSTSVSFTDSDIPNSLIRVYSTDPDLMPVEQSLTGTTLTITYEAQSSSIGVAVEMVKQGLEIVDDVISTDTDKALSAKQGYVLNGAIGDVSNGLSLLENTVNDLDIPEKITDLDDVNVTSIQNGQVLAWNNTSEKFENVNQSSSGSQDYTTTETLIGTYNGKPLYRNVITGLSATAAWQGTYFPNAAITAPISNVKEIISSRAIMNYSEGISRNSICSVVLNNNNNTWSLIVFDDITINTLILEYTKTTD